MILKFLSFWSTFIGLIDVGYNYIPNLWTLFCGHLTLEIEALAGREGGGQQTRGNVKFSSYVPVNQSPLKNESSLVPLDLTRNLEPLDVRGQSVLEFSNLELQADEVVIQQTYKKQIVVPGNPIIDNVGKQTEVNFSSQSDVMEVDSRLHKKGRLPAATVPRYLNLEPSLAMDWLEISWEELHIKERVGAGTSSAAA